MEFGTKIFSLFLGLSKSSLARNNFRMMFFSHGWIGMEFGTTNFFFLFLGLSNPGLARNKARMMFFNFLNFSATFLGIH